MYIWLQARGEDTHYLCRYINDDIADAVAKYPTRFSGLGTLPMQVWFIMMVFCLLPHPLLLYTSRQTLLCRSSSDVYR